MPDNSAPPRRWARRIIILIAAGLVMLLMIGVGVYGLITGPPEPTRQAPRPIATQTPSPGSDGQSKPEPASTLEPLPATDDPEEFAQAVTEALFNWDTHSLLDVEDHRMRLIEAADPTGVETPGLISDLDNYFPDEATWTQLQEYQTRQRIDIDTLAVPGEWEDALAAGGPALEEGTIAYTVHATRLRDGVWVGDAVESAHPVEFTMFLACPPRTEQCALLRLSVPGEALQ